MAGKTLYDNLWDAHLVRDNGDGSALIYIDRHLVHEVTSPQAFDGLRLANRKVRRPDRTVATVDHNVPTTSIADRLHIAPKTVLAHRANLMRKLGVDSTVALARYALREGLVDL